MEHLGNFAYFLGLCITDGHLLTFSVPFLKFPLFLSNEGGNKWIIDETSGFYGICKISPEDLPQATLSQRQRKFILNSSTQAKLEQQV